MLLEFALELSPFRHCLPRQLLFAPLRGLAFLPQGLVTLSTLSLAAFGLETFG